MTEMVTMKGGNVVVVKDEKEESLSPPEATQDVTMYLVFVHLFQSIFSEGEGVCSYLRIKKVLIDTAPMFREAILNARRDLILWTRAGSPIRALLVTFAGIAIVLSLTGMLVFMLFVLATTVNAIVISLLISLAAVGGFLASVFACLTAIYISVLFIAAFVIITLTISSIIAACVAAGWIGFIWITWLALSNSAGLAKSIAGQAKAFGELNTHNA